MPEKRSQSALPPQGPWGRVGRGVGTWGVHSLTSSPSHPSQPCFQSWHWISQPQTQSLSRETSVMGCTASAPQKLGSWREASGSPLMAPRRAPLTAALTFAARRERGRGGERGKGGSKGWRHGVRRDLLLVQRLRLYAPHTGGPGSIPGWGATSHMHVATEFSRHNREARMPQIRPSAA